MTTPPPIPPKYSLGDFVFYVATCFAMGGLAFGPLIYATKKGWLAPSKPEIKHKEPKEITPFKGFVIITASIIYWVIRYVKYKEKYG
jgi:hypothetical protein